MDNVPAQDPRAKSTPPPVRLRKPTGADPELRASDADRERVADILRDAFAEGRLDADEHAERLDAAYAAKTLGALEPLTRDLPVHGGAAASPSASAPEPVGRPLPPTRSCSPTAVAVFSGSVRKGRWRVGSRIKAVAVFGGVEIDLTDAVFESPEVVVDVVAVFGGVTVKVPENVGLQGSGVGVFGGFDVHEQLADDPRAPVVRVRGAAVFGGCEAKPKRGKKLTGWVRKQLGD